MPLLLTPVLPTRHPRSALASSLRMDRQPRQPVAEPAPAELSDTPDFLPEDLEPRPFNPPPRRRVLWVLALLATVILLAVLPPLVHVNRYQKQIAQSISQSLGRPVHTGEVTLNLLPLPGFTIQNFVVSEDPAFGSEPVIRAGSVTARLRWRSLWHRRVEFSRITLTDSSVNLVRRQTDGHWNLESILLQASRIPVAPTGQRAPSGDRPRFPYIEASGARINLKMGLEKMPLSLTDADFALWLPQAEQWHLRLEAHPSRTDTAATDTGLVRLEGTLGRATQLAEVPIDLHASWTAAPLGAASYVLLGRDAGLRGELNLNTTLKGTVGDNAIQTRLQLEHLRRADFVPSRLLDADITCTARAFGNLHRLADLHCVWPTGSSQSGLTLTGEVPDTLTPSTAILQADLHNLPASNLLDAFRLATPRIAPGVTFSGTVNAQATCCNEDSGLNSLALDITQATVTDGTGPPFLSSNLTATKTDGGYQFAPIPLDLGGAKPVQFSLGFDSSNYGMGLEGPTTHNRLAAFAAAFPLISDGLADPAPPANPVAPLPSTPADRYLMLISNGTWGQPQTWDLPEIIRPLPPPPKHRR